MDNIAEVVALLRHQAQLEQQLLNGQGIAVVTEQDLLPTRRRLASHAEALSAVLQTARARCRLTAGCGPLERCELSAS
jgi:hypothetical protein